jgi:tetratricopeptide (TPR) repeat protein
MGKSWFLHRARLLKAAAVRALVVDWDSSVWRAPLTGEPRCAAELFEPIALRLAQVCGIEAADPYWLARAHVKAQAHAHRDLRDRFEDAIRHAEADEHVDSRVVQLLVREGIWDQDAKQRKRKLETWRYDVERYTRTFEAWGHASYHDEAAIEPDRVLAKGLREALRRAAQQRPLLLLLDTAEVLSDDLDGWLRWLLVPLCSGPTPLLLLVGSRRPPDSHLPAGSREGWLAEVPRQRLRVIPFAESVRFTVKEIEAALKRLQRPVTGSRAALAVRLHQVTRGVPLALRALLDLHEQEGGFVLNDLAAQPPEEELLDETEAVRTVVGKVAKRMLHHLELERRPEREQDLRDIVALALLPRADRGLLARLWQGLSVQQRLLGLGARYALLSGGDLHPTVRDYLRRHWRGEERPAVFDEALAALDRALADLPPPADGDGTPEAMARTVLECNLATWRLGDAAVPILARNLAVALAYDEGADHVQGLLRELPLAGPSRAEARKLWKKPERPAVLRWLRGVCDAAADWSEQDRACLALVEGIALSAWGMKPPAALSALALLKRALGHFGAERLPQRERAGQAFFDAAGALDPYWSKDKQWLRETEEAYRCAVELHVREAFSLNNLGILYRDQKRYDDAEQAYGRAIELDPLSAHPHNGLGNLYRDQKRYADAERAFRRAIELDSAFAYPHHNLGLLYRDQKRYDDAEQAYGRAIELDPLSATPHHGLGYLYRDQKRYNEAERAFQRALQLDPKSATAHNGLGNVYYDRKRYEDAELAYRRAIELDPNFASAHNGQGYLCRALKRYAEAEQACRRAIELDPKDALPHNGLGNVYYDQKRYEEGELAYQRAIELDPNFASAHNGLGNVCRALKRYDEAERTFRHAIELDPKFAFPYCGLGCVCHDLKCYDEAERAFRHAIELDPKDAISHNGLGSVCHTMKCYDEAEQAYRRAIDLDPNLASPHYNLGNLCRALKRYDEAEQALRRASELDPNDAYPTNALGLLYSDLKRYDQAEQAYRRASELDPKFAYPYSNLGYLYSDLKRYDQAEQAFRHAIELDPKDAVHHNGLGNLCRDLKRYAEAEQAYRRARELDPKAAYPHSNLGLLYRDLTRYAEAEQAYRRARELDPKDASSHNGLGNICYDRKRYDDAEQAYRRAIELDANEAVYHSNLGEIYLILNRDADAERCFHRALEIAPAYGGAHCGLAWLCLLREGDKEQARAHAERAWQHAPDDMNTPLAVLAATTWTAGWVEARSSMPQWLATCEPCVAATGNHPFIVPLLREIRRQGGLEECAAMLRAVEDRPWWKPWSEAVGALAAGKGAEACTTPEAIELYRELAQP